MALRRYTRTTKIKGGKMYASPRGAYRIYAAVKKGRVAHRRHVTHEGERLDIIAGRVYGNAKLWWVIAAASGVGWALQVPPGTVLKIPSDLGSVASLVG
jgi:nucleoid-associated protein YgaU